MEQLEELLADACARADEVCHAADPPRKMRELLAPLRVFVTQQLEAAATAATHDDASERESSKYENEAAPSPAKVKAPTLLADAVTHIKALVPTAGPRSTAARSDSSNHSSSGAECNKSTAGAEQHKSAAKSPSNLFSGAVSRFQAFVRGSSAPPAPTSRDSTMAIVLSPQRKPKDKKVQLSDAATRIQALVRGNTERISFTKQRSFLLQGTKVLKKYVLKSDRFPNCHVLDSPHGDIAPNFRRLADTPLYGSAQPSLEGIQMILNRVAVDGFTKVVWINLREEPVLYVDGHSYTARRTAKLNENDVVPGITGHKVQVLETSMANSLREQLAQSHHQLEYWHEYELHQNELLSTRVDPTRIFTVPELFESDAVQRANASVTSVAYYRIPIERENAPEHADVEQLMALIQSATPIVHAATVDTAFIFNCQMGKRRTTTALVLAQLIWQRPHVDIGALSSVDDSTTAVRTNHDDGSNFVDVNNVNNDGSNDDNNDGSNDDNNDGSNDDSSADDSTDKALGNFAVIREVQKQLAFGRQAKKWVDATIDDCAAIFNIRSVINEYHELSLAEPKPAKRSYYLHHALSFLERYFYIIVFGAYILSTREEQQQAAAAADIGDGEQTAYAIQSFSTWLQRHPNLFRLLDDMGGVRYRSDKVLLDCVIKEDHFFGHARMPYILTRNVPNFRRIGNEPLFGAAQCLEAGFYDVVSHLRTEFDHIIWLNLREEAVIYVSGKPFAMRHPDDMTENVTYPGIEADEVTAMESQFKDEVTTQIRKANGLFIYWYEPSLMYSEETMDHVNPDTEIKTLTEIYDDVAAATAFDVQYARIPVTDETAPEEKDLDDMVRLLAPVFMRELEADDSGASILKTSKTAVVCNCQMGRGRTTTALVCTYMLRLVLEDRAQSTSRQNQDDDASTAKSVLQQLAGARTEGARRQSSAVAGDFVVIRKLLATLENGDQSKQLVDFAVDECEHMQNLRECIAQCRDLATDRDVANDKRDHFMLRAVNYLERYFYLICFASYLLEERANAFNRTIFVKWMSERYGSALYALLDNLCFEEELGAETHVSSMRWRWRRKRKLVSRLE